MAGLSLALSRPKSRRASSRSSSRSALCYSLATSDMVSQTNCWLSAIESSRSQPSGHISAATTHRQRRSLPCTNTAGRKTRHAEEVMGRRRMLSLAANQIVIRANHQAPAAGAAASVVCLRAGGRLRRLWCHRKALPASTAGEPHGEPRCVTSSGHDFIRAPFGFTSSPSIRDSMRAAQGQHFIQSRTNLFSSHHFTSLYTSSIAPAEFVRLRPVTTFGWARRPAPVGSAPRRHTRRWPLHDLNWYTRMTFIATEPTRALLHPKFSRLANTHISTFANGSIDSAVTQLRAGQCRPLKWASLE